MLDVVQGSQLGAVLFPKGHSVLLPQVEFKLRYLKNKTKQNKNKTKKKTVFVFSYSKIIIWAYSFWRKGNEFLLFLKVISWDTDLWVMIGVFVEKKPQHLEEECVFNWKSIKWKPTASTLWCL